MFEGRLSPEVEVYPWAWRSVRLLGCSCWWWDQCFHSEWLQWGNHSRYPWVNHSRYPSLCASWEWRRHLSRQRCARDGEESPLQGGRGVKRQRRTGENMLWWRDRTLPSSVVTSPSRGLLDTEFFRAYTWIWYVVSTCGVQTQLRVSLWLTSESFQTRNQNLGFTMRPGTTTRVVAGATFISFVGLLVFLGMTTTRYPVRRALGARHDTVMVEGPTSEISRLVGAGITEAKTRQYVKRWTEGGKYGFKPVNVKDIKVYILKDGIQ